MRAARTLLIALSLAPLSSCFLAVAAAGGALGYVKYDQNGAYQDFETSVQSAWTATREALEDQGYTLPGDAAVSLAEGSTEGEIRADEYRARIEKHPGGIARVHIRIGLFDSEDNKRKAKLVLEQVAGRL